MAEDDYRKSSNMEYLEDEYGYVQQGQNTRASQALMSQLPSRHIDSLLDEEVDESKVRRRNSRYRTLKLKNATLNSCRNDIDEDKIYKILNSDLGEEENLKTLREMPISLALKRRVKERLDTERKIASNYNLGSCLRCRLRIGMTLRKFCFKVKNFFYLLEPWHASMKNIQGNFGSCVSSYFVFLRWLLYLNLSNFFITLCFVIIPQVIINQNSSYSRNETVKFHAQDILTGAGWLKDSLIYFGSYSSQAIPTIDYNMPLAYLFSTCSNMIIILIVLSVSITSSYQKNYVDTAGEIKTVFCNKIFSAWDYSIQTENAAMLQRNTICNDIKELLYAKRLSERKITPTQKWIHWVTFFIISLLSLAAVIVVGYLVYFFLQMKAIKIDVPILHQLRISIILTLISSFSYYLLKLATKLEAYNTPKRRLYLTMIRVVLLRTVMLGIVIYFWMIIYKPPRHQKVCYETELGSEFYRLILMNFLSSVFIFTVIFEFIRKLVHLYVTSIAVKEFDVAYNTLDLIYFQSLTWLALFYVPFVSLINVIVLVLMFYSKKWSLFWNCRPPKRSWSINEMQTFYLVLTFIMFLFSLVTVGYTIFGLETSDCGPFRDFPTAGKAARIEGIVGHFISDVLKYGTSPVILVVILCALCLAVHYMRAMANAHISVIKKIRETLILASKDKVFLLQLFDEAVNAHIQKNKADRNNEKSNVLNTTNCGDIVVNEAYSDHSLESPAHMKYHPNYIPADVPVNRLPQGHHQRSSPHASPFPPHQPGFRHVLISSPPGMNS